MGLSRKSNSPLTVVLHVSTEIHHSDKLPERCYEIWVVWKTDLIGNISGYDLYSVLLPVHIAKHL